MRDYQLVAELAVLLRNADVAAESYEKMPEAYAGDAARFVSSAYEEAGAWDPARVRGQ